MFAEIADLAYDEDKSMNYYYVLISVLEKIL